MRVFICWSGRSESQARLLERWLREVTNGAVDPFVSQQIRAGEDWNDVIRQELKSAAGAIVCLTPENLRSTWMCFEAGAVAVSVGKGRVCPYLFGVLPDEVPGPLQGYQARTADVSGTERLIAEIIGWRENQDDPRLQGWQDRLRALREQFENELAALQPPHIYDVMPGFSELFRRLTFEEPLDECQNQHWLNRFLGAAETRRTLEGLEAQSRQKLPGHVQRSYDDLLIEIKRYEGAMEGLIKEERFAPAGGGKYAVPEHILEPSEKARRRIRELASEIARPRRPSVIAEAPEYEWSKDLQRRKDLLYKQEQRLDGASLLLSPGLSARLFGSEWQLDRMVYYRAWELAPSPPADPEVLVLGLQQEVERRIWEVEGGWTVLACALYAVVAFLNRSSRAQHLSPRSEDQLCWSVRQIEHLEQPARGPSDAVAWNDFRIALTTVQERLAAAEPPQPTSGGPRQVVPAVD